MKMFCRLCLSDCEDCHELYDSEGKQNEIYEMTAKYFEEQLRNVGVTATNGQKYSRVICAACWRSISEFYRFQLTVLKAQEQYETLMRFEDFVKLEYEMDVESTQALDDERLKGDADTLREAVDPVRIPPAAEGSDDQFYNEEINASTEDDEDDKPLLSRKRAAATTATVRQRRRRSTKSEARPRKTTQPKKTPSAAATTNATTSSSSVSDEKAKKSSDLKQQQAAKVLEQDAFIAEHWKREMQCDLCSSVCADFSVVTRHFREAHNARGYVVCCQRKYFHRFHLVDHLQVHLNPEYFKCGECGKCSANRRSLATHMKWMHPAETLERRHECEVCHKRFVKIGVLRGHMDTHAQGSKDFVCVHCGKGFVLETRLNIHVRNVHTTHGGGVCDQCGKSFRGRYALKRHLLEHAGVKARKWPCDQCEAALHSKFSLGRHKRLAHHDGSTVYVCSECGKVALTEDALRSHKKYMHEKERKYKCNICGKAFKVAVVLKEHMTTHTGEDLYQCLHCPKTFKVSANMHHHRKRAHPKEWAATRQQRSLASHTDLSAVSNEVVL